MRFSVLATTMSVLSASPALAAPEMTERAIATGPGNGIPKQAYLDCLFNEVNTCKSLSLPLSNNTYIIELPGR